MKRVERQAVTSSSAIQKSLGGVRTAAAGMVAGLGLATMVAAGKRALDYASSLGEVSQQLGVSTKDLQVFRFAASQVGVSQEEMDKSLSKLTQTMGKAQLGSKQAAAAFGAIGISVDQLKGKDAGEVIRMIADRLSGVVDPAKRAAVEVALFGKTGQKLDTLLSGGRKAIDGLAQAAEKLGIVLSDEQIQNADDTADKLSALKQVLEARIAGVVADNASAILSLANSFATLSAKIAEFWAQNPAKAMALMGLATGAAFGSRFGPAGTIVGAGLGMTGAAAAGEAMGGDEVRLRGDLAGKIAERDRKAFFGPGGLANPKGSRSRQRLDREISEIQRKLNAPLLTKIMSTPLPGTSVASSAAGGTEVGNFLASGGGKKRGPKGKSAEQLAREAERAAAERQREADDAVRRRHEVESDIRRAKIGELQASQAVTHNAEQRFVQSQSILDLENEQNEADLRLSVLLRDRTQAEADNLAEIQHREFRLEQQALEEREADRTRESAVRLEEERLSIQRELLEGEARLAETAAERRAVELRILEHAYREERERLGRIIRDSRDADERQRASQQLAALPARQAQDRAGVMRGTAGPLEAFMNSLPNTAAKANEALESVAANGLQSLTDGITDAIMGAKSLGDVFKNVAKQIIADLIRIAVQRAIVTPLANAVGNFMGGGGGAAKLPGFATGGTIKVGGMSGVDRNLLSLNGMPIAKVSMGERIQVDPANSRAGRPILFDLRGAVMTQDLLNQMNAIGAQAAQAGATMGETRTMNRLRRPSL